MHSFFHFLTEGFYLKRCRLFRYVCSNFLCYITYFENWKNITRHNFQFLAHVVFFILFILILHTISYHVTYFSKDMKYTYRISANSFRGNYSFLNFALFTVTFDLYFINLNSCRGNYSREETIQGRKLFAEIR